MGDKKKGGTGFGPILKALREEAGLSQQALADLAGMNVFGVAKLEQGVAEPRWETVLAISKALGRPVGDFVQPEGDPTPEEPERPAGKRK